MKRQSMTINRIPQTTYRWLHMNESAVDTFEGENVPGEEEIPAECIVGEEEYSRHQIKTGMGEDFDDLFVDNGISVRTITVPEKTELSSPIRLSFALDSKNALSPVFLNVGHGASATLILFAEAKDQTMGRLASQIRINMGKQSKVQLVEVIKAPGKEVFCDIGVKQDQDASFELVQLFLAGRYIYAGCRSELLGKNTSMQTDIAYQVSGNDRLDMNYVADHYGSRSTSQINVSGVLRDEAKKLFRGTIDFKRGAKGALGNEKEDVLLIDEGVHNQSIPLILCAEEDVEGNHGATIGKLAEDVMFYLQSRGLAMEEIYEMMAKARIDAVCSLISDQQTRERIG